VKQALGEKGRDDSCNRNREAEMEIYIGMVKTMLTEYEGSNAGEIGPGELVKRDLLKQALQMMEATRGEPR